MTYGKEPKPKKIRPPLSDTAPDLILAVLGVAGLAISGWSLGTMLHTDAGAPWPIAVFGVAVFDLVAMLACILVYVRRADPWSAAGARVVMTLALVASAVVNGAHGLALGGWTTAVVLAAAPLAFEIGFELRHRTLTALIWIVYRKAAWQRLTKDAHDRIKLPDPDPGERKIVSVKGGSVEEMAREILRLESAQESGSGSLNGSAARIPESGSAAPRIGFSGSGGSVKDRVADLIRSGVTDPAAVVAALPDANSETVRRMVRMHRNGATS